MLLCLFQGQHHSGLFYTAEERGKADRIVGVREGPCSPPASRQLLPVSSYRGHFT